MGLSYFKLMVKLVFFFDTLGSFYFSFYFCCYIFFPFFFVFPIFYLIIAKSLLPDFMLGDILLNGFDKDLEEVVVIFYLSVDLEALAVSRGFMLNLFMNIIIFKIFISESIIECKKGNFKELSQNISFLRIILKVFE